jgi:glycosyltransferase involved in cell wall biosynthesis
MRVAVVTQYFPSSVAPWAGHSAYQTLRPLARRCELKVFYPEITYPSGLAPRSSRGPLDHTYQPPDVAAEYIPYPALPVVSRPLNGWNAGRSLLPRVRAFRPDIVFGYVAYPDGLAAVRIARALRVPSVVTAIGSDLNRMPDPLVAALTRRVLRNADFIVTVSGDLLKTALVLGAHRDRSQAIINGCDISIFHDRDRLAMRRELNVDADADVVVYVGRLDVRKGLRELIEAAARLRRTRSRLRCYLVGDGADQPALERTVSAHDASAVVTFVPPCQTDRVATWMGAADVVTLPSYMEGCPNVVLEALASGRPVVATNVGGIPEIADDSCGRLVPPRDVGALTSALDATLSRTWDAAQIAARHARSWSEVADDNERILTALVRR